MDCLHSLKLISLELDGRLDSEASVAFLQHIEACMPCAQERSLQRRASRALRASAAAPVPAGLAERVAAGVIEQRRRWKPVRLPLLRIAAALAFCFVIGGLGGYWIDASATEARAGAAAEDVRLAQESAAWHQLGADDALNASIIAIRRRQHQQQASAAATEWARLDAEAMSEILRLLPSSVATAWCQASGVSDLTFKELCRRSAR
ncbi:MAG: hypothetical protein EXS14_08230 [Planctomycetes bacterium]|nr:hypothetical protein [Planctomycetota bacterium]